MAANSNLAQLSAAGVSVWLDDLSRGRITSGNLASLINDFSVVGVTTNPSIFQKALTSGEPEYEAALAQLRERGVDAQTAVRELTVADVCAACDLLAPTYEATNGVDGRVSLEVDPRLAHDANGTIAQAQELWQLVNKPNLMIKIPATTAGLEAITAVIGAGISVNVTLIFSVERYSEVLNAWLSGLELAAANGHDLRTIESVASFFVSRVDTLIDPQLDQIASPLAKSVRGKAALANAQLAWGEFLKFSTEPRWLELSALGAHMQRPLWASTGVKDPTYPDTLYVSELVCPNTVNTMPEATLMAFANHGTPNLESMTGVAASAKETWETLSQLGISREATFSHLEEDGVAKFIAAWNDLLENVAAVLAK